LSHCHTYLVRKEKEKEKKRNNDLGVPSHNTFLSRFLIPRIFIAHNMGHKYYLF